MLEGRRALDFALELARAPTLARAMSAQALPPDTLVLIRIAAGCNDTILQASEVTGATSVQLREAAVLYLQKVLFAAGSDCHRILGVSSDASRSTMREHMRWLMQWLHPDHDPDEWESVFAERVLTAWREAKTTHSDKQAEEGAALQHPPKRSRRIRQRWVAVPIEQAPWWRSRQIRVAFLVLAGVVGLTLSTVSGCIPVLELFGTAEMKNGSN